MEEWRMHCALHNVPRDLAHAMCPVVWRRVFEGGRHAWREENGGTRYDRND